MLGSIEVKGWPASVGRITLKAASGQEIADHWQHGQASGRLTLLQSTTVTVSDRPAERASVPLWPGMSSC